MAILLHNNCNNKYILIGQKSGTHYVVFSRAAISFTILDIPPATHRPPGTAVKMVFSS